MKCKWPFEFLLDWLFFPELIDEVLKGVDSLPSFYIFAVDKPVVETFGILVKSGFSLRLGSGFIESRVDEIDGFL